ncbi:hypothetical protein BD626DRAFT_456877 [Schizophyllum amplum]|uniref:RRM domain-containing protein n=1 Tax=Schizophyllum amplum TaxID=97359 RepID=A0A550CFC2_9AGAR|nr:hypothetical protein BD626DRAFT_456877 [Auriculariopsis ampla]
MSETTTKRIHISGLTPNITYDDLKQRLSTFGTVRALDGIGATDDLGGSRPFAYATLEGAPAQLTRCVALLSGATWKGAKLRVGDARPDFRERIKRENEAVAAEGEVPRKRRRRAGAVHAEDMTPLDPEHAAGKAGWTVTPLGRVYFSARIRPGKPLPPPIGEAKQMEGKKKKRAKAAPTRARRRRIDMGKWGSTQLKGMYVDTSALPTPDVILGRRTTVTDVGESSEDDTGSEDEKDDEEVFDNAGTMPIEEEHLPIEEDENGSLPNPPANSTHVVDNAVSTSDLAHEQEKNISFLHSLFGDADNWGGREEVDAAALREAEARERLRPAREVEQDDDIEIAPVESAVNPPAPSSAREASSETRSTSPAPSSADVSEASRSPSPPPPAAAVASGPAKLKDLFAPRDEEPGFSLLGALDLDLELDEDAPFPIGPAIQSTSNQYTSTQYPSAHLAFTAQQPTSSVVGPFTLDASKPLFFPRRGRGQDVRDVARANGWDWRGAAFHQPTEGSVEEVARARWEAGKLELTRDWKKRWREAARLRRRRGGGAEGE